MRSLAGMSVSALALAGAAIADTAYFEPATFTPERDQMITLEASFNDDCCVPKYAVRSDAYVVIAPDGAASPPDRIEVFADRVILEQAITQDGTTRFSTGERLGRKGGQYVWLDGAYHNLNPDEAPPIDVPEGTPILSSQTATVSDTYVTIGTPSWSSVNMPVGRLTITPQQHPSTLRKGDMFEIALAFDGAPIKTQTVLLTRSGQKDRPGDEGERFKSDVSGRVMLPLNEAGTHLVMVRMQAPAPIGAETDIRSYTTSLTFNVAGQEAP